MGFRWQCFPSGKLLRARRVPRPRHSSSGSSRELPCPAVSSPPLPRRRDSRALEPCSPRPADSGAALSPGLSRGRCEPVLRHGLVCVYFLGDTHKNVCAPEVRLRPAQGPWLTPRPDVAVRTSGGMRSAQLPSTGFAAPPSEEPETRPALLPRTRNAVCALKQPLGREFSSAFFFFLML